MEILGKLGINGKILLAQIVNFFLLMYVLKRFLYQPLLNVMKEREKKIKEGVKNADKARSRLLEIEENAKKHLEKASREADRIIERAHVEGEEHKNDIIREAKDEVRILREETKMQLQKEKERIVREVREETGEIAIQIAKKIIKEKVTAEDRKRWAREIEEEMEQVKVKKEDSK